MSASYPRLLGDVGGTNARLALQQAPDAPIEHIVNLPCKDFAGPQQAIEHYLAQVLPHTSGMRPRSGVVGIANPILGDHIALTNAHWAFSISALRDALGLESLRFLNDFTVLALSLPGLPASDLVQVGGTEPMPDKAKALLGAGTGLGVSGLVPVPGTGRWVPLEGEGGHVTLPAFDEEEARVLSALRALLPGHVSAERGALSGQGLQALYQAHCHLAGAEAGALSPADVTQHALDGSDPHCVAALNTFCAMMGTVAADLALTLGAQGGVYIGGGIVPKLGDFFLHSPFRARFESKGRFGAYLARIPVYVIHSAYPALIGASRA
jgi:glucokinase